MSRRSSFSSVVALFAGVTAVLSSVRVSGAEGGLQTGDASPPTTQPAQPTTASAKAPNYFVASKGWTTRRETEPPAYVQTLDKVGVPWLEDFKWLEFGLEQRTRYEYRDDDYRRTAMQRDEQFLMRSRAYLGIREIVDPFRFGLEFQDARQFNSDFPETNQDVDEADFLQAFGELYFKDALGTGRPVRFQVGRMSFDYVDRRLVGRNRWRNTTNSFDGFRLQLGQQSSDWQFDFLAAQPTDRRLTRPDRGDEERWFYGLVGAWRKWSKFITLEPYYFILDESRKDPGRADREIHTWGLHGYGLIGKTGFDYDFDVAFQYGEDEPRKQRAFASYGEVGYTFEHAWKPRVSFSTAYASGDRDPTDNTSERFDRLFGVGHGWSTQDLFTWQNMISPKIRLEVNPWKPLRFDTSYGAYWLASDSDAWVVPGRRDRTGTSGDCVGQEVDCRIRYQIDPRLELEVGYSHFFPGPFVENTGPADDGDFFYVQTTLKF